MSNRPKRRLEDAGRYEATPNSTYVPKPDVPVKYPNLYRDFNPNLLYLGIGNNMYGDLIDYNAHKPITMDEARARIKQNFRDPQIENIKHTLRDIALDKYRTDKKYK